jgi:hypothetical protein
MGGKKVLKEAAISPSADKSLFSSELSVRQSAKLRRIVGRFGQLG